MTDRLDGNDVELTGDTYRARYDFETTAPSTAVVDVLRTVAGEGSTDLDPLYGVVDPEALDGVFDSGYGRTRNRRGRRTVTFSYRNYSVTVRGDGIVTVRPVAGEDRRED